MNKLWLILLCLPLLTGCGLGLLEREVYPLVISVDMEADGRITVGIQAPESLADGAEPVYDVLCATGDTPEAALSLLRASTPFPLNFCQVRLCLVGYDLASAQELRPLLRWLLNLPAMRPDAHVMIALGQAESVMEAQKPDFGMRLSNHLNLLFERLGQEDLLPDAPLSLCVQRLSDPLDDLLLGLCALNQTVAEEQQKQQDAKHVSLLPKGEMAGRGENPAEGWVQVSAPAGLLPADEIAGILPRQGETLAEGWMQLSAPAGLLPADEMAGMLPRQGQNPVEYIGSAVVARGRVAGTLTARQTQLMLQTIRFASPSAAIRQDGLQLSLSLPEELKPHRQEITQTLQTLQQMGCDLMTFSARLPFSTDAQKARLDYRTWFALSRIEVE